MGDAPPYKYTNDTTGAVKIQGWKKAGMQLYEGLFKLIDEQREEGITGVDFERKFMLRENTQRKKRKEKEVRKIRPSSWGAKPKRARTTLVRTAPTPEPTMPPLAAAGTATMEATDTEDV